eukprot:4445630-Prymnesium_polylepis.1
MGDNTPCRARRAPRCGDCPQSQVGEVAPIIRRRELPLGGVPPAARQGEAPAAGKGRHARAVRRAAAQTERNGAGVEPSACRALRRPGRSGGGQRADALPAGGCAGRSQRGARRGGPCRRAHVTGAPRRGREDVGRRDGRAMQRGAEAAAGRAGGRSARLATTDEQLPPPQPAQVAPQVGAADGEPLARPRLGGAQVQVDQSRVPHPARRRQLA